MVFESFSSLAIFVMTSSVAEFFLLRIASFWPSTTSEGILLAHSTGTESGDTPETNETLYCCQVLFGQGQNTLFSLKQSAWLYL